MVKQAAYEKVKRIFDAISAKADDHRPCSQYFSKSDSGHFIKMVHNGIEYALMQILAEVFYLLKKVNGFSNKIISDLFSSWMNGKASGYLLEITSKFLIEKVNGEDLIDKILDVAKQNGTGTGVARKL